MPSLAGKVALKAVQDVFFNTESCKDFIFLQGSMNICFIRILFSAKLKVSRHFDILLLYC